MEDHESGPRFFVIASPPPPRITPLEPRIYPWQKGLLFVGPPMLKKLDPKHRRFVIEYLKDQNASQAAVRAGYGKKNCDVTGPRLLGYVGIRAAIDAKLKEIEDKVIADKQDVLRELSRLMKSDIREVVTDKNDLIDIKSLPDDIARCISSIEIDALYEGSGRDRVQVGETKKIKFWDKTKAAELIGKHLKMFTDRVELGLSSEFAELLKDAKARADE